MLNDKEWNESRTKQEHQGRTKDCSESVPTQRLQVLPGVILSTNLCTRRGLSTSSKPNENATEHIRTQITASAFYKIDKIESHIHRVRAMLTDMLKENEVLGIYGNSSPLHATAA